MSKLLKMHYKSDLPKLPRDLDSKTGTALFIQTGPAAHNCSNTVHEIFRMPNTRTHRLKRLSRSQNTQREGQKKTRIELNHDNMNENKGCLSPNYEPSNKHTIACTLTSTLQRRSSPSVLGSTRHHNGAHWEAGLGPRYSSTTVTGLQDGYAPRGNGDLDLVHGADTEHTH